MPMIRKSASACACFRIKPSDTNYFVLLADPIADGVGFVTVVEIFEPGGATPPNAHVARCDGREAPLARGDVLIVPPGAEHVVENTGSGKLYCLTTMMPDEGFAALIRGGIPMALAEDDRRVLCEGLVLAS
jgi:oxalate decarboxylase/phosphoglucose isomerase-like protein (cupin superfamily)